MPKTRLLEAHLIDANIGMKGKYAVAELLFEHAQARCSPVPAGTRGIITATTLRGDIFLFPHTVLNERIKSFRDGELRIVPKTGYRIIGRIDHA